MNRCLHVVLNNFLHDSRVLKECHSLQKLFGMDVTVFALHEGSLLEREEKDGLHIQRFKLHTRPWSRKKPVQLIKYAECWQRMLIEAKRIKPDIVHAHDLNALPIAVQISKRLRIPLIYDAHELETEVQGLEPGSFLHALRKKIERRYIAYADQVICVSQSIASYYQALYPSCEVDIIMNCPAFIEVERTDNLRRYFGIDDKTKIFLYQGAFTRGRALEQVMESFSLLTDDNCCLVMMGYGGLQAKIEDYAARFSNIYFKPAVDPSNVLEWTASADYGICLADKGSLSREYALANKIFEYMMAGIPVLVSDRKERRDFVQKYGIGWVVPDHQQGTMVSIIRNLLFEDTTPYKSNALSRRREFCWEKQEETLIKVYQKCMINSYNKNQRCIIV